MRRRKFIGLLGGAATWPLAAAAQHRSPALIGFLHGGAPGPLGDEQVRAFVSGLRDGGFIDGENVEIEFRWANGRMDLLPALARELLARPVQVLFAGGPPSAKAAQQATASLPIVFTSGSDPVELGLVASFNRPGGNLTGVNIFTGSLLAKRLELLRELVPNVDPIGVLINPNHPEGQAQLRELPPAASSIGVRTIIVNASTKEAIEPAFADLARQDAKALLVGSDVLFYDQRDLLVSLSERHRIPMMEVFRDAVSRGALVSYGSDIAGAYKQAGLYVARILKGDKPSDLPVVRPTKLHMAINLRTAKMLGLAVPASILVRADEVIE
jgi:putative ABC transport system substrate-binding protein